MKPSTAALCTATSKSIAASLGLPKYVYIYTFFFATTAIAINVYLWIYLVKSRRLKAIIVFMYHIKWLKGFSTEMMIER